MAMTESFCWHQRLETNRNKKQAAIFIFIFRIIAVEAIIFFYLFGGFNMTAPSQKQNPVELVMQIATGYIASSCLDAVARLNIADALAEGPKPVAELAKS